MKEWNVKNLEIGREPQQIESNLKLKYAYSHLLNTSPGQDISQQGWVKVENQGLNSSQGLEKWKT